MKLVSWNINGIRAVVKKKEFWDFLEKESPDVLCLQEIKISFAAIEKENIEFPGYEVFWNPAERPGYSGTAILMKNSDLRFKNYTGGIGVKQFDAEGRSQTVEFDDFFLINNYFPNANHELSRLQYKLDYNDALLKYAKKLEKKKPVIICGDLNVAHREIDLTNPKANAGSAGFTIEERRWMDEFLRAGFVDTFRHFYPDEVKYSWWSYRFFARDKNIGWRIDYFCVSKDFVGNIKKASIMNNVFGSDHCPVLIEI